MVPRSYLLELIGCKPGPGRFTMKALIRNYDTGKVFYIYAVINERGGGRWETWDGTLIGVVGFPIANHEVLKIYYRRPE